MDECDARVTDEDGFLAIMKELDQSCGQRDWVSAFLSGHWRYVALERSPIYISNSTCVMSQMECGRPGRLEVFSGVITVVKKIESTIQPNLRLGLHSSANKDVVHDAL